MASYRPPLDNYNDIAPDNESSTKIQQVAPRYAWMLKGNFRRHTPCIRGPSMITTRSFDSYTNPSSPFAETENTVWKKMKDKETVVPMGKKRGKEGDQTVHQYFTAVDRKSPPTKSAAKSSVPTPTKDDSFPGSFVPDSARQSPLDALRTMTDRYDCGQRYTAIIECFILKTPLWSLREELKKSSLPPYRLTALDLHNETN